MQISSDGPGQASEPSVSHRPTATGIAATRNLTSTQARPTSQPRSPPAPAPPWPRRGGQVGRWLNAASGWSDARTHGDRQERKKKKTRDAQTKPRDGKKRGKKSKQRTVASPTCTTISPTSIHHPAHQADPLSQTPPHCLWPPAPSLYPLPHTPTHPHPRYTYAISKPSHLFRPPTRAWVHDTLAVHPSLSRRASELAR
jgi:hypothetical protein